MNTRPFVLVCDDNAPIGQAIAFHLDRAGYRAQAVASALECFAVARHDRPDLILMDIMMPGMDGATASDLMKDVPDTDQVPIVLVSGMTEEQVKARALEIGAADYLLKPFRKDCLLDVVRRCIGCPVAWTGRVRPALAQELLP